MRVLNCFALVLSILTSGGFAQAGQAGLKSNAIYIRPAVDGAGFNAYKCELLDGLPTSCIFKTKLQTNQLKSLKQKVVTKVVLTKTSFAALIAGGVVVGIVGGAIVGGVATGTAVTAGLLPAGALVQTGTMLGAVPLGTFFNGLFLGSAAGSVLGGGQGYKIAVRTFKKFEARKFIVLQFDRLLVSGQPILISDIGEVNL